MAAAIGNQYAAKSKRWQMAIERALEKRSRAAQVEALDELAEKFIELCEQGDLAAFKELGDRLDGKASQQQIISGDPDAPLQVGVVERRIVDANPNT